MRAFAATLGTMCLVSACKGDAGPQGPTGSPGAGGPPGVQGPVGPLGPGLTGLQIVFKAFPSVPSVPTTSSVTCPPGLRVLSGGHSLAFTGTEVGQSYPLSTADGWAVSTFRPSGGTFSLTVIAICGNVNMGGPNAVPTFSPEPYLQSR
jgi:hypothetical protein